VKSVNCWFLDDQGFLKTWGKVDHDPACNEYWINLHEINLEQLEQITKSSRQIVFYDWTHADAKMSSECIDLVKYANSKCNTIWSTINQLPIDNLPVKKFDFYWNRCKSNHAQGPWQMRYKCNGQDWPHHTLNWDLRTHKYLSLVRTSNHYRDRLYKFLESFKGFSSNRNKGHVLESDIGSQQELLNGINLPPAKHYFDNSYVSCQVESQHLTGGSVVFSEKTYDHLIQGRFVLNFGPQYFYRCLEQQGWKLWQGIDLNWDSTADDFQRFEGYIQSVTDLFKLSDADLHDLFLLNKNNIEHNWQQLYNKPYYALLTTNHKILFTNTAKKQNKEYDILN